jgi:hypothetical protein
MKSFYFLLIVVFWVSLSRLLAQDTKPELGDDDVLALGKACNEYVLADRKGADTVIDFAHKVHEQVRQRMSDTGVDKDMAYRDIAVDWLSDNRRALERKDLKAVLLVCWWFSKLVDSGIGLPTAVRENLTPEDARGFVKFLTEQTTRNRDVQASKAPQQNKDGDTAP